MKNFIGFAKWLVEVEDVASIDVNHVSFQKTNSDPVSYKFDFNVNNKDFSLIAKLYSTIKFHEVPLKNVWEIIFTGSKGYSLTGESKTDANAIYTQMLLRIKKLFELESVNGLTFAAADPKMTVIYHLFFNRFLGKSFTKITSEIYLKNEYLEEIKKQSPSSEDGSSASDRLKNSISKTSLFDKSNLSQLRSIKNNYRMSDKSPQAAQAARDREDRQAAQDHEDLQVARGHEDRQNRQSISDFHAAAARQTAQDRQAARDRQAVSLARANRAAVGSNYQAAQDYEV